MECFPEWGIKGSRVRRALRASQSTYLEHLVKLRLGLLEVPQDGKDCEHRGEIMADDGFPGSRHDVLPLKHQPIQCILEEGQGACSGRGRAELFPRDSGGALWGMKGSQHGVKGGGGDYTK